MIQTVRYFFVFSVDYDAGLEPKQLQGLMGHQNISTTMDIYTELTERKKLSTTDKLNVYFDGKTDASTAGGHSE